MKLGLLTYAGLPRGDDDDRVLVEAFKQRGVDIDWLIWNRHEPHPSHDVVLIRSVWDYHKTPRRFLQTLERLHTHTPVLNAPGVVRWNSDKTYLKALQEAGLPIADTQWIDEIPSLNALQDRLASGHDDWFLKPAIGADAAGTLRFKASRDGIESARQHLQKHLGHSAMMLQPFLPSVQQSGELSVMYFGEQMSHAVIKKPRAGDYRVQDTFGGVDALYKLNGAEQALAEHCMMVLQQLLGPVTYARLDFLRDSSGQWLLNEVELIEPSLFFRHHPQAADRLVAAVLEQA